MTKARELAELGTTLSVDGSGNADLAGILTTDGLTVEAVSDALITVSDSSSANQKLDIKHNAGVSTLLSGNNGAYGSVRIDQFNGTTTRQSIFINPNNDISFYEDTGTTAKLFWDASAESLGIGTSSPTNVKLQLNGSLSGTAGTGHLAFGEASTPLWNWRLDTTTADLMLDRSYGGWQSTPVIAFDRSSGNVGIGTSAPTNKLTVAGGIDFSASAFSGSGTGIWSPLTNELGFVTAGSTRLRIDASGNVGIGTSSPSANLHIGATTSPTLRFERQGSADGNGVIQSIGNSGTVNAEIILGGGLNNHMRFVTNGTERMRIDASGNLLVGKTATDIGTVGHQFLSDGQGDYAAHTSNGTRALLLNRKTSDGEILDFRKDGTTVGSIGTINGSISLNGPSGVRLYDTVDGGIVIASSKIYPANASGSTNDGVITLGSATTRFNNLFLSGGVYLGGTGAANLLDDYEEGTWTPTIVATGTNPTVSYSARNGAYVKVGNSVTIHVYMLLSSFSGGSGTVQLGSLPFTPSATRCSGSLSYSSGFPVAPQACLNSSSSPSVTLYYFSGSTVIGVPTTDLNGNEQFRLSLTYEV